MGNPSYCYTEILKDYIGFNAALSECRDNYNEDYLQSLSEKELEELVKQFNQNHKPYACFSLGVAVTAFVIKWSNCEDMINAVDCCMKNLYSLFGIQEPDEVDFTPKAHWIKEPKNICLSSMWEENEYTTIFKISCSNCGKPSPGQSKYRYCPNCGIEMENYNDECKN